MDAVTAADTPAVSMDEPVKGNNTVSTVTLFGQEIVSLTIDGKQRLCLAQISNTLLKDYSYNEIHNRRVALGITCVQCTPVQLEVLRRAGAMPVSSRRCGMISLREAERLVKSFLHEISPPQLPDDFAFDVQHSCAWGCRGFFYPSRYNSSRAKCIQCFYCQVWLSPNKFIFHYHRTGDGNYRHPDAANFNSWRRHLHLWGDPPIPVQHAWEDVKAMFNGGSRKRALVPHYGASTSEEDPPAKKPPADKGMESHTNPGKTINCANGDCSAGDVKDCKEPNPTAVAVSKPAEQRQAVQPNLTVRQISPTNKKKNHHHGTDLRFPIPNGHGVPVNPLMLGFASPYQTPFGLLTGAGAPNIVAPPPPPAFPPLPRIVDLASSFSQSIMKFRQLCSTYQTGGFNGGNHVGMLPLLANSQLNDSVQSWLAMNGPKLNLARSPNPTPTTERDSACVNGEADMNSAGSSVREDQILTA